ncbi:MAG: NAD-dependent dihydropyrimidine dehydrogenase subunit PreA [Planctomycetes bacterium]|nr:NAD-dependent dihydropyrimidine dehydrogenase subunit PreA [Planctomycetota bacterium]
MADLSTVVDGLKLPNPLVIASGPPGTNANVIGKAFDEGWGAVICKTVSLDASKVVNVQPRYGRLRTAGSQEIIGWENIELISDRGFDLWIDEFKQLKDKYPDRVLIASIMEEYRKDAWIEIVERCQAAGVDAFECNFSCPHGLPERKMGSAMGENPEILEEVCKWVMSAARVPVWAKMTPNVTHIEDPSRAALRAGVQGIAAINTIRSVIGVDLETLRPEPNVEGYTTPGGYSSKAVMPIALRMCMEVAKTIRDEFPGRTLSGIGGVESGNDAAQFILLGCHTVQVCTYVMKVGYRCVREMLDELSAFMDRHQFKSIDDFRGHSLQYFTTHYDLVRRQAEARAAKAGPATKQTATPEKEVVKADHQWSGDDFVKQSDALARG